MLDPPIFYCIADARLAIDLRIFFRRRRRPVLLYRWGSAAVLPLTPASNSNRPSKQYAILSFVINPTVDLNACMPCRAMPIYTTYHLPGLTHSPVFWSRTLIKRFTPMSRRTWIADTHGSGLLQFSESRVLCAFSHLTLVDADFIYTPRHRDTVVFCRITHLGWIIKLFETDKYERS